MNDTKMPERANMLLHNGWLQHMVEGEEGGTEYIRADRAQPPVLDEPKMEERAAALAVIRHYAVVNEMVQEEMQRDFDNAVDLIERALAAQRIASGNDGGDERVEDNDWQRDEALTWVDEQIARYGGKIYESLPQPLRIYKTLRRALAAQPDTAKPRGGEPDFWAVIKDNCLLHVCTDEQNARQDAASLADNLPVALYTHPAPTDHQAQPDTGRLMECIRDFPLPSVGDNSNMVSRIYDWMEKHAAIISAANEQAGGWVIMSADNWNHCPACLKAERSYFDVEEDRTLREDYEFYMENDGTLHIDYCGQCQRCNFIAGFHRVIDAINTKKDKHGNLIIDEASK